MTDTESAFLLAICAQPDEDTPRLVFADYLDEQGGEVNVAWAKLIRTQIARARDPDGTPAQTPADFGAEWSRRMGFPATGWQKWSRGFPLRLWTFSDPGLSRFADAPPIPLREVELLDVRDDEFVDFVRWPGLRHVRKLELWEINGPFVAGTIALAGCEHFRNLQWIRMARVGLTDEAAIALLDSPHLTRVTDLRITPDRDAGVSNGIRRLMVERFGAEWDRL